MLNHNGRYFLPLEFSRENNEWINFQFMLDITFHYLILRIF